MLFSLVPYDNRLRSYQLRALRTSGQCARRPSSLGIRCLGRLLRLLHLGAKVVLVAAGILQHLVCGVLLVLLVAGDGARLDEEARPLDRDDLLQSVLRNVLELRLRGVALLHALLAGLGREDEELRLVELEAVHVGLEALLAAVPAAVVHGDADGRRQLDGDLGLRGLLRAFSSGRSALRVQAQQVPILHNGN